MAVVTTGEELFINAAWTTAKKVPAKSPYGVPLVLGENAFATLEEAIAYAGDHSLVMVKYIDGDKTVAFSDADGKVNYISSKEIKGTETEKKAKTGTTWTAQSKQTVANKITLDDSQATSTTVAGFKDVTLNSGAAEFTVLGGANTVAHVHAVNSTTKSSTIKDSATVSGKADGTLTVSGAKVALAGGAWAEVQTNSGNGDEITIAASAFKMAMPGDPSSINWDDYGDSVLNLLPGYATVALAGGASATDIQGGTFDFTHATDAVYTVAGGSDYLSSLTKTLKYTRKNSGKLTVTDATFGEAIGYATVAVTGASADFDDINDTNLTETVKTTYKETRSAKNTTVKETYEVTGTETANGTLTVEGIGDGGETARDVTDFAKVTVKNARLGRVIAVGGKCAGTNSTETVTTPIAGGSSSVKVTTSETYSSSVTATGTLATAKGNTSATFRDIMGYSKVDLVNATVEQDIRIGDGGRPGTYSYTGTTTTVDEVVMQKKYSEKHDYTASGTVTMSGGSVGWRIEGAATVKLTGTTVVGSIDDGGTEKVNYSNELSINSKTKALTSSYSSSSANQLKGTVTMTGGAVTGSEGIIGYQTITLDGAAVKGAINDYYAYRTTFSAYKNEFSSSFVGDDGIVSGATLAKQTWSSGYSYAPTAALTLKNGATVVGDVYGVKTLTLSSGAELASGGVVAMRNGGIQESSTVTSKGGLYTENYQYTSSQGAPGTVTLNGATVGDLRAAKKVTATDATLGEIYGVSSFQTEKITRVGSNLFSGYDGRYFVDPASGVVSINSSYTESENAVGNATLTRTTAGTLYGVGTVKLTEGSVEGAWAYTSKSIASGVSSATASNAVTSDTRGTVGTFTATSAGVAGSILGYSTVTLDHTKVGGSVGGWNYEEYHYGSMNVSSSIKQTFSKDGATLLTQNFASASSYAPTVALTLKNGAFVAGDADGIKTLNVVGGAVLGGTVYMANCGMKQTESITSDKKTGLYEEKEQYTSSRGAAGTVTLKGASGGTDQICGNISGAAKVTATDAVIGDLTNYGCLNSFSFVRKGAELYEYYGSRYIYEPTEYTSNFSFAVNASGTATLTRTSAGRIVNFATVKLTDSEIVEANGGSYGSANSTTLKGGVYTFSHTTTSGVLGTFTATGTTITGNGGVLTRFATVTLTSCFLTGIDTVILGGSATLTMSGSGATLSEAMENANANVTSTFKAAGTLTAKSTTMDGCIIRNYATVTLTDCGVGAVVVDEGNAAKTALTLAGTNYIGGVVPFSKDENPMYSIDGIANVTVKSGYTLIYGKYGGYSGTVGNDTVTVNAKSELLLESSMLFGEGADSLVVNGTARIGGAVDAENLEKLSGSGMLVVTDGVYAQLKAGIDAGTTKLSGKLNIVNAGFFPEDVFAVRTKAEELADNEIGKARKLEGMEMNGWLCGTDENGMFADTVDWIDFLYVDGANFELTLNNSLRAEDVKVDLWKGGAEVAAGIAWDYGRIDVSALGLTDGDYQLKLSIADTAADVTALSYKFGIALA